MRRCTQTLMADPMHPSDNECSSEEDEDSSDYDKIKNNYADTDPPASNSESVGYRKSRGCSRSDAAS